VGKEIEHPGGANSKYAACKSYLALVTRTEKSNVGQTLAIFNWVVL